MDILPTPSVTAPQAAAAVKAGSATALTSDFETFLTMLTAQARYQDPLEPIDSTEYASQLAQFSAVEQQVQTNDLLTAMTTQLGSSTLAQFAGWIGMEARSTGGSYFQGQPLTISPNPSSVADQANLIVSDEYGTVVQRLPIPISDDPVQWAGVSEDGVPFAAGLYTFQVESRANGEVVKTDSVEMYNRITEARSENGQTVIVLEGGAEIQASDISALREPGIAG